MKSAVFRRNTKGIRERDISYCERIESVSQMIRRQFKSTPLYALANPFNLRHLQFSNSPAC
jgi:hypothetical protein